MQGGRSADGVVAARPSRPWQHLWLAHFRGALYDGHDSTMDPQAPAQAQGADMIAILGLLTAIGSAVAAWGAALFARQQASAARAQNSLHFIATMVGKWESPASRRRRAEAARD